MKPVFYDWSSKSSQKFGKFSALSNINLVLGTGQCVALVGPNGCGKTTLIKVYLAWWCHNKVKSWLMANPLSTSTATGQSWDICHRLGRYPGNLTIGQLINMVRNLRPHQNHYDEELLICWAYIPSYPKMSALSGGTIQKVKVPS